MFSVVSYPVLRLDTVAVRPAKPFQSIPDFGGEFKTCGVKLFRRYTKRQSNDFDVRRTTRIINIIIARLTFGRLIKLELIILQRYVNYASLSITNLQLYIILF